jgi:HlyD family secretion protein
MSLDSLSLDSLLASVTAALSALTALLAPAPVPPTLTGYAEAEFVRVAPELAGRLSALAVRRGDRVAAGALLFSQDDSAERAARDEARARLRAAEARQANLQTGKRPPEVAAVVAQLREAEAQLALDRSRLGRRERLTAREVVSQEGLEEARALVKVAEARVQALTAQVEIAHLPGREEERRAAEAEIAAAAAALAQADWRLGRRTVTAPVAATVDEIVHWPGEQVAAGAPVLALLPPEGIKLRFYVPEPLVGGLRPGQPLAVRCDGCAAGLRARISFIASEAEYTPPVIYSTGNREKLVFLVEARPLAEPGRFHPGQPVDVTLTAPESAP